MPDTLFVVSFALNGELEKKNPSVTRRFRFIVKILTKTVGISTFQNAFNRNDLSFRTNKSNPFPYRNPPCRHPYSGLYFLFIFLFKIPSSGRRNLSTRFFTTLPAYKDGVNRRKKKIYTYIYWAGDGNRAKNKMVFLNAERE